MGATATLTDGGRVADDEIENVKKGMAASHQASLELPSVQEAIAKGRSLIAGFDQRVETRPIGGYGLGSAAG